MSVSSKVKFVCVLPVERRKMPRQIRTRLRQIVCSKLMPKALAFLGAAVDGVRKRNADEERKTGLNGVVQPHACPFNVASG